MPNVRGRALGRTWTLHEEGRDMFGNDEIYRQMVKDRTADLRRSARPRGRRVRKRARTGAWGLFVRG